MTKIRISIYFGTMLFRSFILSGDNLGYFTYRLGEVWGEPVLDLVKYVKKNLKHFKITIGNEVKTELEAKDYLNSVESQIKLLIVTTFNCYSLKPYSSRAKDSLLKKDLYKFVDKLQVSLTVRMSYA